MTTNLPASIRATAADQPSRGHPTAWARFHLGLGGTLLLALALAGCKPKATPNGTGDAPPLEHRGGSAAPSSDSPPTVEDVAGFLRGVSPPFARVADVKMDAPIVMPNTSPAQRVWLCSLRFAFLPTEDLLGFAPDTQAQVFHSVTDELAGWSSWREAYARSSSAHLHPAPEWHAPASLVPAAQRPVLLSRLHPAGQPLPPTYGKLRAEWQVDHWQFQAVDLDLPEAGAPRGSFQSPSVVLGSPEANAFIQAAQAAVAQAKEAKTDLDARYQADLTKATRPGTLFRGQLTHRGSVVPVEVRLLPAASGDAQEVGLEVRLPATPGESFGYVARRSTEVPLGPPLPPTDAPIASTPTPAVLASLPKGDLRLRLVSANGKDSPYNDTVPVKMLWLGRHEPQPSEVWLHLRDGHLEGRLAGYSTDPVGIVLSATQPQGQAP